MSTHKVFGCMGALDSRNSRIIASVLSKLEAKPHDVGGRSQADTLLSRTPVFLLP